MSKIPVSVCIIAKNEEKYIGECLKRLEPYGFEIVVTDTGSTDQTVEIAKQYTDKVFEFEWVSDFSAARNFCVSHASNNWILTLDCDEYVHSIDVPSLRRSSLWSSPSPVRSAHTDPSSLRYILPASSPSSTFSLPSR